MIFNAIRGVLLLFSVLTGAAAAVELARFPSAVGAYLEAIRGEAGDMGLTLMPASDLLAWGATGINLLMALAVALMAAAFVLASRRRAELVYLSIVLLGLLASPVDGLRTLGIEIGNWELEPRIFGLLGMAALPYFLARFPRVLSEEDLAAAAGTEGRSRVRRLTSVFLFRSGEVLSRPWAPWILAGVALVLTGVGWFLGSLLEFAFFWGFMIWAAVSGIHLLRVQIRTGEDDPRKKALSLFSALNMMAWTVNLLLFAGLPAVVWSGVRWGMSINVPVDLFAGVGFLGSLLLLTYAVFVKGDVDPRLVIKRTAVFGMMAVLSVFVLGGAEVVGSNLLVQTLALPEQTSGWLAGGAFAVAFGPMRRVSRGWVERLYLTRLPVDFLVSGPRSTAAVLFVDLEGYTRISGEDPDRALHALTLLHRSGYAAVGQHRGRVVKTIGDAVMAAFPDAVSAGMGALELRSRFGQATELLGLGQLRLRSGIDVGEVAEGPDGDLYGQVVNLAARLQGAAEADQILVSGAVAEGLSKEGSLALEPEGTRELKNIPEPTSVFSLEHAAP